MTAVADARFVFASGEPGSTFACRLDDKPFASCTSPKEYADILAGEHRFDVRAIDAAGNVDASPARREWRIQFEAPAPGPQDAPAAAPETQASTAPVGEMTLIADTTRFLYTGVDPIQRQVAASAMDAERAAVLRGRVTRRDGSPLAGVRVTVLDQPQFGRTATRDDGGFEFAVNGGGFLVVEFEREGYLPSQRQLRVPTQDFERVEEVVLVPFADQVSGVDLAPGSELQVAQSAPVSDADGTRRTTLLLQPGTDATATMRDGSTRRLGDRLNIRATEYTIGASGPAAMPGELPPTSAYTYAVEYSVDEASAAVAVRFDKPVVTYVDNFLNFPAGTAVPMGYYDRDKGQWIPSPDGVVIEIRSEAGARAQLDVDGDGVVDTSAQLTALGIDDAELTKLAELYQPGKSLWRTPISHFTPWDYNWPYGLPDGARPPDQPAPDRDDPPGDDRCGASGSIILCESQTLGERAPIAGTPYALSYTSERVPGRRTGRLNIPLTGSAPPATLARVDLRIHVAGKMIEKSFSPAPNLSDTFDFDGKDAYGRFVQGSQPIDVRIVYVYRAVYREPGSFQTSFASMGSTFLEANRTREEISVRQDWSGVVVAGRLRAPPSELAGWNIDVHHTYDPIGRTLYLGDGTQRSAEGQNFGVISRIKTDLDDDHLSPFPRPAHGGLAIAPDGTILTCQHDQVIRIAKSGATTVVAGTGTQGFSGDGGPATAAELNRPSDVALAPDGSIFIIDGDGSEIRIRKIGPDGNITTVAGNGAPFPSDGVPDPPIGDGGPAVNATLYDVRGLAVDAAGALYFADSDHHAIRRVGLDGIISTIAGNGNPGFSGDGGLATQSRLRSPGDVVVRDDGTIFVADSANNRVRRIDPDGMIQTVAGDGSFGSGGDGGKATDAQLNYPRGVVALRDGGLLIADSGNRRLRGVNSEGQIKRITTVAGNGMRGGEGGDGGSATQAEIDATFGLAVGFEDTIYFTTGGSQDDDEVRTIAPGLPAVQFGEFTIASDDAQSVYVFDRRGRHLRTVDALTNTRLLAFSYDAQGRLESIKDADSLNTVIQRDAAGKPSAIIGPYGQRTALQVSTGGYLSQIENPAGERQLIEYDAGGLMTKLTDPRDGVHTFEYDPLGRLTKDSAPGEAAQTLSRSIQGDAVTVRRTTAEGRATSYRVERTPAGSIKKTVTGPTGASAVTITGRDGNTTLTQPDGTRTTTEIGPDPRFGMEAPLTKRVMQGTPGGRHLSTTLQRAVTLEDPGDVLSVRRLTDTVTVNGRVRTSSYDASTRTITRTTPAGRASVTTLDGKGRIVGLKPAPGVDPIAFRYDTDGRLSNSEQGAQSWTYAYDAQGRVAARTDAAGKRSEFAYDAADRMIEVTRPSGNTLGFGRDASANTTSIKLADDVVHQLGYSAAGQLARFKPAGSAVAQSWDYDRDHGVTNVTLPGGRVIEHSSDTGGRPTGQRYDEATTNVSYADSTERASTIKRSPRDGGSQQTLAMNYDAALPIKTTSTGSTDGSFDYTYDANFLLSAIKLTSGTTTLDTSIRRDNDGVVTGFGPFSMTRAGPGAAISEISDETLKLDYAHDALARLSKKTQRVGAQQPYAMALTHDNRGRITRRVQTIAGSAVTFEYSYDDDGQLLRVDRDDTPVERYSYDAHGNRTSRQIAAGPVQPLTYDAQQRLATRAGDSYSFDAAGFLATRGSDRFDYSARGELLQATVDTQTVRYAYDGLGRRVARTIDTDKTQYLYGDPGDPFRVTAVRAPDGQLTSYYYDEDGHLFAMQRGAKRYYIATDQVATPLAVIDTSGTAVKSLSYDSFGNLLSDSAPEFELPFGFAGGLTDPVTKLTRFGFRDYEPASGRWTARDPALFGGGQTNLYAYVANDPVALRDPTGLWCVGGSVYAGYGGGGQICHTDKGTSVCTELGFGLGSNLGIESGEIAETGTSVLAEANFQFGVLSGKAGAELHSGGCLDTDLEVGVGDAIKITPDGLDFGLDPVKVTVDGVVPSVFTNARAGVQAKIAAKACFKFAS